MQDGVQAMTANGKGSLGARVVACLKRYWYHIVLFILTTLISFLVAAFRQFELIAAFAFPLAAEVALLVYENAAKDVLRRDSKSRGMIEELFSLFYAISTSGKSWRDDAIDSAKEAVNRCREDLSNIKDGRLPINPFSTSGKDAAARSDKYLYEVQRDLIDSASKNDTLLSIHCADTVERQKRWDPDTYKDGSIGLSSSFFTYIIKANIEAASRGVCVKRLFIAIDHRMINSDEDRKRLERIERFQKESGFVCRFIEQETVKSLGIRADDILIAKSAAVSFKEQGWSAKAFEIVDEELLEQEKELFSRLWDSASETFEGLFRHGQ